MKYFILREQRKNILPEVNNWFGILSPKSNTSHFLSNSNWTILDAEIKQQALYADILSFPCILMTEDVLNVFHMYHEQLLSKPIILLDKTNQLSFLYYLAKLPSYSVLREESEFDRAKSEVLHGILDKGKVCNIPFFLIEEVSRPTLVIREDVTESLIRRKVKGIKLQELEVR